MKGFRRPAGGQPWQTNYATTWAYPLTRTFPRGTWHGMRQPPLPEDHTNTPIQHAKYGRTYTLSVTVTVITTHALPMTTHIHITTCSVPLSTLTTAAYHINYRTPVAQYTVRPL